MDVFNLSARLTLDSSQYDKGLDNSEARANRFGGVFGKIGSLAKTGMKVAAGAAVGAGTAIGALAKASVSSYADYEQMVGGVKKLYGNMGMSLKEYAADQGKSVDAVKKEWQSMEKAQNLVLKNAQNAYKTSGMSANKYMDTATQFSASLIDSLHGNTVEAAKQTDVAMRAISDNFNTFGGNVENIENAFKGFSKQNYMMLDNLKLGYGGTKSEMERLIADANEYGKATGQASDLSIDSFSDIITAIDLVQQKQHIAGTTAREAATTIAGSTQMAKGAWENLLTGFADADQPLKPLIDNFLESVGTVAKLVIPRFGEAFNAIAQSIPTLMSAVPEQISKVFEAIDFGKSAESLLSGLTSAIPSIVSGASSALGGLMSIGTEMMGKIAEGLPQGVPKLLEQVMPMLSSFSGKFREGAGKLVDAGLNLLLKLAQGIANGLPALIKNIPTIVSNIAGIINDNMPKILVTGVKIIIALVKGIISAIPTLIANIPQILKAIIDVFMAFSWINLGKVAISGIGKGLESAAGLIKGAMGKVRDGIVDGIKGAVGKVAGIVRRIKSAFNFGGIAGKVRSAFNAVKTAITHPITTAKNTVTKLINKVKGLFPLKIGKVFSGIKLPHFNVSGGSPPYGLMGKGKKPSFSVSWNRKAMDNPWLFTGATLFGAGEAGDEVMYGKAALMRDIEKAVGKGMAIEVADLSDDIEDAFDFPQTMVIKTDTVKDGGRLGQMLDQRREVTINAPVTVDGAENPEQFATRFVRQLDLEMRMV